MDRAAAPTTLTASAFAHSVGSTLRLGPSGATTAAFVNKDVDRPKYLIGLGNGSSNLFHAAEVGRYADGVTAELFDLNGGLIELDTRTSHQHDTRPTFGQLQRHGPADASPCPGD